MKHIHLYTQFLPILISLIVFAITLNPAIICIVGLWSLSSCFLEYYFEKQQKQLTERYFKLRKDYNFYINYLKDLPIGSDDYNSILKRIKSLREEIYSDKYYEVRERFKRVHFEVFIQSNYEMAGAFKRMASSAKELSKALASIQAKGGVSKPVAHSLNPNGRNVGTYKPFFEEEE